jgi:TolB-like protein
MAPGEGNVIFFYHSFYGIRGNKMRHRIIGFLICFVTVCSVCAQNKINIAVLTLKNTSGITSGEVELISDRLRGELFSTGRVNVMERDQMQDVLKEQGFQQSGACTDEACMVEMGQLLGVEMLISGSIGKLGTLYMVNVRMIDVGTAQIVKVVSEDIKGGIEGVVTRLKTIAVQLVSDDEPIMESELVEEEHTEVEVTTVEEEVEEVVVEEKEEEKEEEEEEEEEEKEKAGDEKNRNRAGVRLSFNLYGGSVVHTMDGDEVERSDESFDDLKHCPFFNPQLRFIIKIGSFLAVDIGPGFMWGNSHFIINIDQYDSTYNYSTYEYEYLQAGTMEFEGRWNFYIANIPLLFSFSKRLYPLKINAGFMFDINFPIFVENIDLDGENIAYESYIAFCFAFGFRGGVEILVNPHVGFSLDLLFRFFQFTLSDYLDYYYDDTVFESMSYYEREDAIEYYLEQKPTFRMPMFGIGIGFNIYY